ncbi:hypothetical protein AMCSP14_000811 [Streptococcus pneumoniae 2070531]|nr:hypothetical protein AMCSP14_000811 [Streptococcus pneumoniae 2070531]
MTIMKAGFGEVLQKIWNTQKALNQESKLLDLKLFYFYTQ